MLANFSEASAEFANFWDVKIMSTKTNAQTSFEKEKEVSEVSCNASRGQRRYWQK